MNRQERADVYRLLADPTRLRLLELMLSGGFYSVSDLVALIAEKEQPTISHHLRLLRTAGVIRAQKDGLWAYYHVEEGWEPIISPLLRLEGP